MMKKYMICIILKYILIPIFFAIFIKNIINITLKSNSRIKNSIPNNNSKLIYPRVSVIIPVYNTEQYLTDCLDSLLKQTLKEIEIICIDDGSTDNSLSILYKYSKMDNRIIILKQENKGGGIARNYGMSIAKGEYLCFLDSDDFFNENLLYETVNAADNILADIVVCLYKRYNNTSGNYSDDNYGFIKKNFRKLLFNYNTNPKKFLESFNPAPWNKLFRHSFIKKNDLYFQGIKRTNDLYFTITSLVSAKKIYFLDKVLIYYRVGILNNCQSTNTLYPFDFYKALLAVKKFLKEKNIFFQLEKSYKKFAEMVTIYNLNNNDEKNILIYEELKREGFKKMGINIIPSKIISDDFDEKYKKYLDSIYFRHINIINDNSEIKIIKKSEFLIKPKVSVIIFVYNIEKFITECLDSISNQTLKNIEIICVNDGSTDNSLNIIKKYAMNDKRIQIISQINKGISESRNIGVKYSKGEYIYFINGDDYLELNALSELYKIAKKKNLDILLFDGNSFSYKSNIIGEKNLDFYSNLYSRRNNYSMIFKGTELFLKMKQNKEYLPYVTLQFIQKKFYINAQLSFYPGIFNGDNLFSMIALLKANKTSHIKKNYFKYRIHKNSITDYFLINNIYGYLIIYCEIQKLMEKYNFKNKLKSVIIDEINVIERKIFKSNKLISEELKNLLIKKMTIYQEIQYSNIIKKIENKDMKEKIKKLKIKNYIFIFVCFILLYIDL